MVDTERREAVVLYAFFTWINLIVVVPHLLVFLEGMRWEGWYDARTIVGGIDVLIECEKC